MALQSLRVVLLEVSFGAVNASSVRFLACCIKLKSTVFADWLFWE